MSTSRPIIPAAPTSIGATDDAALGGIFSRSNLANPISGADVNGVPVNNATITLTINNVEQTFMLNQANDQTLEYTIAESTSTGVDPNAFTAATISGNILTLTRESGATVPITLPSTGGGTTGIASVVYANGLITVTGNDGSTAVNATAIPLLETIRVNGTNHSITGTTVDLGTLTSNAMITVETDNLNPDITDVINVSTTAVDIGGHRAQLQWDANTNTLSLSTPGVTPPPAMGGAATTFNVPTPSTIFTAPTPPTPMITADPGDTILTSGTVNGSTVTTSATITGGPTNTNVAGTVTIAGGGGTAGVVFPASTGSGTEDYSEEGTYTVTTTTVVQDGTGVTNSVTETDTFVRFLPFYLVRGTEPTSDTTIQAGTVSTAAFPSNNTFDAPAGTGFIYISVPQSVNGGTRFTSARELALQGTPPFRFRMSHNLAEQDGTNITYDVYQVGDVQSGTGIRLS